MPSSSSHRSSRSGREDRDRDSERSSRKRKEGRDKDKERERDRDGDHGDHGDRKRSKTEKSDSKNETVPAPIPVPPTFPHVVSQVEVTGAPLLTADKIKEMMNSAKQMITKRKEELHIVKSSAPAVKRPPDMDKAQKMAELQKRIQASYGALGGLGSLGAPKVGTPTAAAAAAATAASVVINDTVRPLMPPGSMPPKGLTAAATAQEGFKPTPLILDHQGRTVDAKTGEVVELRTYAPTLKANIHAKRREDFKTAIEKAPEEITESSFFDPRVSFKAAIRTRRQFKFHEKGKFEQQAQSLRTQAQLERLQGEISQAARKTGIASAAKLASIVPKKLAAPGEIPVLEWWDAYLLPDNMSYVDFAASKDTAKLTGITMLVEHPTQMAPPAEAKPAVIPIMLTKKERKKMRRQHRTDAQKDEQEKVRLGLMPPPEPKVRMANLMRVLGTEAVQDPTKMEAHVRAQMAKREIAHKEANAARQLTPLQRSEKKAKKLQEDTTQGVHVTVFRLSDLKDPAKKYKVETNAKQLYMTGLVVMFTDCTCVVMEGGPKQQKKFKHLMLNRIKWGTNKRHEEEDDDDSDAEGVAKPKHCQLVWEGLIQQRNFTDIRFKVCPTEAFAREQFKRAGVEHYWNQAYSTAVLETAGEEL